MKLAHRAWTLLVVFLLVAAPLGAAPGETIGPAKGHLVIVGGGLRDLAILKRFIELAGGPEAPILVIPTAAGGQRYDQSFPGLTQFREAGAKNVALLHTYDRAVADSEEFVKPLKEARGVFFTGGRHWRLADAYLNTRTHKELVALLERGGVIGGTSAGATILGSFMVRGDTKGNTIMVGDHLEGLGFVHNVTIDQHVLRRNRQFDLIDVIRKHPELLGIGIDENTAIVVSGDAFEVIGQSLVLIYDNQRMIPPDGRFYFLMPGDKYNLKTRQPKRAPLPGEGRAFDNIVEQKWP